MGNQAGEQGEVELHLSRQYVKDESNNGKNYQEV